MKPDIENQFKKIWEKLENPMTQPRHVRKVHVLEFNEFQKKVYQQDEDFSASLVESLYGGDGYILKRAFPGDFCKDLISRTHNWGRLSPSSFHKMVEGIPDYHRIINADQAKNYSFKAIRHSYYFFPWNGDPLKIFEPVNERWRVFKFLGGFRADEYEKNRPLDGVIDRIQICRYPPGGGSVEPHSDPYLNQRVIIGGMMGKRGIDYEGGGFYFIGKDEAKIDLEDELDVGDMVCGYPTIVHGVDTIGGSDRIDWEARDGRWFLGLYSNDPDYVKDKQRGFAVQLAANERS